MKNAMVIRGALVVCVALPAEFFLLYRILVAVGVNDLTWSLYWVYLVVVMVISILTGIRE
jgi:hypothetical protein